MAEPGDPRLGSEIAGYRIEERIGRGGMGVLYRARHTPFSPLQLQVKLSKLLGADAVAV